MLYGIGTDILNIHQIESSVSDRQDPFVRKIYTPAEIELIESRPIPLYSYATRFAGKEAVFKALNLNGNAIRLNEIEILENENGQPQVTLHGKAEQFAKEKEITSVMISLSYETEYAVAYAAAECTAF